jgi:hypothetical protein
LILTSPATYQLDRSGNLLPGSIQPPQADFLFKQWTGFAEFTAPQGCTVIDATAADSVNIIPDDGQDEVITRVFRAECGGDVSPDVCVQDILFKDCQASQLLPATPVPTLPQWAIIFLSLALLGLAGFWQKPNRR